MKITEFRKLIREEVRKTLNEASINDISDKVFANGWGYTFDVDGNTNTIIAYYSASDSFNLANVENLTGQIGRKAVGMIKANFATEAKKLSKDFKKDLVNSNLIVVTDRNVSNPIIITQ